MLLFLMCLHESASTKVSGVDTRPKELGFKVSEFQGPPSLARGAQFRKILKG